MKIIKIETNYKRNLYYDTKLINLIWKLDGFERNLKTR